MNLTINQLRQLLPKNKYVEHWHHALSVLLPDYDIDNPRRVAAFIAQCAHESGGFSVLQENLNYKPQALRRLFQSISLMMLLLDSIARNLISRRLLPTVFTLAVWGMAMSLLVTVIGFGVVALFNSLDDQTIKTLLIALKWTGVR